MLKFISLAYQKGWLYEERVSQFKDDDPNFGTSCCYKLRKFT